MTAGATDILDGLLEAVPGGVVHVAADGAILKANPEACSFLGLGFDELLRRYTQDFQGDSWYENVGRALSLTTRSPSLSWRSAGQGLPPLEWGSPMARCAGRCSVRSP